MYVNTPAASWRTSPDGKGYVIASLRKDAGREDLARVLVGDAAGDDSHLLIAPIDPVLGKGFGETGRVFHPSFHHGVALPGIGREHDQFDRVSDQSRLHGRDNGFIQGLKLADYAR
jgi:hypothetical protein